MTRFNQPMYEPWMDPAMRVCLQRRPGAFIDVGANTGQTLRNVCAHLQGPYVAFEPQIAGAACVASVLGDLSVVDGTIMPLALADFAGPVKLRRRAGGAGDVAPASASMVEGFRSPGFYDNEVWVFAAIGDSVVPPLSRGPVAAIKIDTEGAELEVVKGLSATIAKYRPPIFFEVLNHFLIVSKQALDDKTIIFREQRVKDLELRLRRMDYEICRILSSGRVERVDRIEPRRVRNQRETMFVAVQKADVALHGLLGLPS